MSCNDSQQTSSRGSEQQCDPKCEPTSIKKGDKLKITVQIDNGQQSEEEGLQCGVPSPPDNVNCAEVSCFLDRLRKELLCKVDQQMTKYTQIVYENSTLLENITKTLSRAPNMSELQKRLCMIEENVSIIQCKVCDLEKVVEELTLISKTKDEKGCVCSKTSLNKKNKPCAPTSPPPPPKQTCPPPKQTCPPPCPPPKPQPYSQLPQCPPPKPISPKCPPPLCPTTPSQSISQCPPSCAQPKPKCSVCQSVKKQSETSPQKKTSQQKCSC